MRAASVLAASKSPGRGGVGLGGSGGGVGPIGGAGATGGGVGSASAGGCGLATTLFLLYLADNHSVVARSLASERD